MNNIEDARVRVSQELIPTYFHINTCVYEIVVPYEGDTKHLMKQVNNPIIAKNITVAAMDSDAAHMLGSGTPNEIIERLKKDEHLKDTAIFFGYPINGDRMDERFDYVTVWGTTLRGVKPDPTQPVVRPNDLTEEEYKQFLAKVLLPEFKECKFLLLMPITENYMFDLSISHVPSEAVHFLAKEEKSTEPDDDVPMPMLSADGMMSAGEQPKHVSINPSLGEEFLRQAMLWKTQHPKEEFKFDYKLAASRIGRTEEEVVKMFDEEIGKEYGYGEEDDE